MRRWAGLLVLVGSLASGCAPAEDAAGGAFAGADRGDWTEEAQAAWRKRFEGRELLCRPTDRSVDLTLLPRAAVSVRIHVLRDGGGADELRTLEPQAALVAGASNAVVLDGLEPDTAYRYRVEHTLAGGDWVAGEPGRFRTQRAAGRTFAFAIQSDSHLENMLVKPEGQAKVAEYRRCLARMAEDEPDFVFSLGDFAMTELLYQGRIVTSLQKARARYRRQREMISETCRSAPFFLAIGNHEGEQGWWRNGTRDSVAGWSARARVELTPGPEPNAFYTGNPEQTLESGLRQVYYAFTWGDALFCVIDPYWYSLKKPHDNGPPKKNGNRWHWTLGKEQYDWLWETLSGSDAPHKFVLAHQLTGGVNGYGRGGIEAASHALGGQGSWEWGGEDQRGRQVFAEKRPGWEHGPIHQMLVETGVSVFFHGHDHVYAHQELDGVVYQACPQPAAGESWGHRWKGGYVYGNIRENSGYLRVTVSPETTRVEYVRMDEGGGSHVEHAYEIEAGS